jgi:hypothetical protein
MHTCDLSSIALRGQQAAGGWRSARHKPPCALQHASPLPCCSCSVLPPPLQCAAAAAPDAAVGQDAVPVRFRIKRKVRRVWGGQAG